MNKSNNNTKIMPDIKPGDKQTSMPWDKMDEKEKAFLQNNVSYTHLAIINRLIAAQSLANYGPIIKQNNNRFIDSKESLTQREVEISNTDNNNYRSEGSYIYNIKSCSGIEDHDLKYIQSIKNRLKQSSKHKDYIDSHRYYEYALTNLAKDEYFKYDDKDKVEVPGMRNFVNNYYDFLNKEENKEIYGDVNTKYWTGTIEDVIINLYKFIKDNFGVVGEEDNDDGSELSVKSKFVKYMPSLLNNKKLPVYCTIKDYNRSEEMIKFINNDTNVKIYNFLTSDLCTTNKIRENEIHIGGKKTRRRQKRKSKRKSTKRRTKRKKLRRKNTKN